MNRKHVCFRFKDVDDNFDVHHIKFIHNFRKLASLYFFFIQEHDVIPQSFKRLSLGIIFKFCSYRSCTFLLWLVLGMLFVLLLSIHFFDYIFNLLFMHTYKIHIFCMLFPLTVIHSVICNKKWRCWKIASSAWPA